MRFRVMRPSIGLLFAFLLVQEAPAKQLPPDASSPEQTNALTLVAVTPPNGARVTRKAVIQVELEYRVADFRKGDYFVVAQMATTTPGRTTDGTFPKRDYPQLKREAGRVKVSFPLHHVWDDPQVKRPFTMWIYLNRQTAPRQSLVIAKAGPVHYESE